MNNFEENQKSIGFVFDRTDMEGVKIITPFYSSDNRGYFVKDFEKERYRACGLEADIDEEFISYSHKDVIRGMHFQTKNPQIKIVSVVVGEINDVIIDLRKGSSTFGQWRNYILSRDNRKILWIPAGFAHGFRVLSEEGAFVSYKCIGRYEKDFDSGIVWDDKELNIDWGIEDPIVSDRDKRLLSFDRYKNAVR